MDLSTGVSMQVLSMLPTKTTKSSSKHKPVLVFLHGSFHGAWCWSEHFFGYFTELGYPVVAPSWRGTGGTFAGEGVTKVKISEHVADLEALLDRLPEIVGVASVRPVLISHSFGGLAVMKCLEEDPSRAASLAGIIAMCSVPPSGNGKLTLRYLQRSLKDSWKITAGFAMKRCLTDANLCRDLFFGGRSPSSSSSSGEESITEADLLRYQGNFARDSFATIDLFHLAKCLPSYQAVEGRAPFINVLPPCLVVGATHDFIVDREGVEETAVYFGTEPPIFVDSPHDIMLGSQWRNTADAIAQWLATLA
jgi:pimeloyl-ACP methyl ester carboxylesterase